MKIHVAICILIFLVFNTSCKHDKPTNPLLGQWILKDYYKAPQIIVFNEFYFSQLYSLNPSKNIYKIKKDSILIQEDLPSRLRADYYRIIENELRYYFESDYSFKSYENIFARIPNNNLLSYFNNKFKLDIYLPEFDSEPLEWNGNDHLLFLDLGSDGKQLFFYNGKQVKLNSELCKEIINHTQLKYDFDIILFASNKITYKDLRSITKFLTELSFTSIKFVSIYDNQLKQFAIPRSTFNNNLTDEDLKPNHKNKISKSYINSVFDFIYKFSNNKIILNGKEVSSENMFESIKPKLINKGQIKIECYFEATIKIEEYIKLSAALRNKIKEIRGELLYAKHGNINQKKIDYKEMDKLREDFPVSIYEINITN